MMPSGTFIDSPDGKTALDPHATTKSRIWPIFAVVIVLFLAWASFMGWMAASYANQMHVNEAQLHQASLVILGTVEASGVTERDGGVRYESCQFAVKEILKNTTGAEIPKSVTVVGNEGKQCVFKKDYFLALTEAEHGEYHLVSAPFGGQKKDVPLSMDPRSGYVVTPDVEGFGTKIIYSDEPGIRAQIEAFLKDEAPASKP